MIFCRRLALRHTLICLLSLCVVPAQADYLTEPLSFEFDRTGSRSTVPDLNTTYILGQKVQSTWEAPTASHNSLSLVHWGKNVGVAVSSFI